MICRDCGDGRKFAKGTVYCRYYGIYIRDDAECVRSGKDDAGSAADRDADPGDEHKDGAAIPQNSG